LLSKYSVSGFTKNSKRYGNLLVYEMLLSKWYRHHDNYCGCEKDIIDAHVIPAGFSVIRKGDGYVTIVGPKLTEDVDERMLTTNALWEAVTGTPGRQSWYEPIRET